MRALATLSLILLLLATPSGASAACGGTGLQLQVLGSAAEDWSPRRAGASYLLWRAGRATALVNAGPGAAQRFAESGARVSDLAVVLFTDLDVARSADLPALVARAVAEGRRGALPIYGPPGAKQVSSTVTFVRSLFDGARGAYRELGDTLNPFRKDTFMLHPRDVGAPRPKAIPLPAFEIDGLRGFATAGDDPSNPALAWRLETEGKVVAVSGNASVPERPWAAWAAGAHVVVLPQALLEGPAGAVVLGAAPRSIVVTDSGGASSKEGRPLPNGTSMVRAQDLECVPL